MSEIDKDLLGLGINFLIAAFVIGFALGFYVSGRL